jgi:aryl-alcohol dehydrogenase-like predicted oxidoreductase
VRRAEWNEISTSALGFGCGSVMGRVGRRNSLRAMNAAWDGGITLFDNARSYGYGEAEGLLGEFLAGKRSQATIVTKFGILPARPAAWKRLAKPIVRGVLSVLPQARQVVRQGLAAQSTPGHFDVATLRSSLGESLRQLKTDYVDVLLLHEPPLEVLQQQELLRELESLVQAGKVRRVGVSTTPLLAQHAADRSAAILSVLQYSGYGPFSLRPDDAPSHRYFRMANHPFGGPANAKRLASTIAAMRQDSQVPATLRDKLHGGLQEVTARVVFSDLLRSGAHVIIPSMLHLDHLRANVAAMDAEPFTSPECQAILSRFHGLTLQG